MPRCYDIFRPLRVNSVHNRLPHYKFLRDSLLQYTLFRWCFRLAHHEGYVVVVIAAILFGLGIVFSKVILIEDVHPLVLGGILYLLSGLFLILFHSILSIKPRYHRLVAPVSAEITLPKENIKIFVLVVLSGVILAPFFYLYGLSETTAVNASLLLNSETLFTVLIAITFFKEKEKVKN